jgi:mannose-1-phosphate guanylyltransferase
LCDAQSGLFHVKRFWEKPSPPVATELFSRGCLWNTFVMVGRVRAFVDLMRTMVLELYEMFERYMNVSALFDHDGLYAGLTPIDFSQSVLAGGCARLIVSNAGCLGWSDLGDPERVGALISQINAGHSFEAIRGPTRSAASNKNADLRERRQTRYGEFSQGA